MKLTIYKIMPFYTVYLSCIFIMHYLFYQYFPTIIGCIFGNYFLFFWDKNCLSYISSN